MIVLSEKLKNRFLNKIDIPKDANKCWTWKEYKDKDGYGVYRAGQKVKAHRYSFLLFNGFISNEQFICHHCDNPSCVNPAHLFQGSPKDNIRDCVQKGRYVNPLSTAPARSKVSAHASKRDRDLKGRFI